MFNNRALLALPLPMSVSSSENKSTAQAQQVLATAPPSLPSETKSTTPAVTQALASAPPSQPQTGSRCRDYDGLRGAGNWTIEKFNNARKNISENGCSKRSGCQAACCALPAGISKVSIFACCRPRAEVKNCGWDGPISGFSQAVINTERWACDTAAPDYHHLLNSCASFVCAAPAAVAYLILGICAAQDLRDQNAVERVTPPSASSSLRNT